MAITLAVTVNRVFLLMYLLIQAVENLLQFHRVLVHVQGNCCRQTGAPSRHVRKPV